MSTLATISSQLQDQNEIINTGLDKVGDGINSLSSSLTSFVQQLTRENDSERYDELEKEREKKREEDNDVVAKKVDDGRKSATQGGLLGGLLGGLASSAPLGALLGLGALALSKTARKAIIFAASNLVTDLLVGGMDIDDETRAALKRSVAAGVGLRLLGFNKKFAVAGAVLAGLYDEEAEAEMDKLIVQLEKTGEALAPIYEKAVKDLKEFTDGWLALPETIEKLSEYIPTMSGTIRQLREAAEEIEKAAKGEEYDGTEIAEGAATLGATVGTFVLGKKLGRKIFGRGANKPDALEEPERPAAKVKKPGFLQRLFGSVTGSNVSKRIEPTFGNLDDIDKPTGSNVASPKAPGLAFRLVKLASGAFAFALTPNTIGDQELSPEQQYVGINLSQGIPNPGSTIGADNMVAPATQPRNEKFVTATSQTAKTLGIMKDEQPFFGYGGTDLSAQTPVVDLSTNTTVRGGDQSIALPIMQPIDWRDYANRD